jgi:hypothetical protein
MTYSYTQTSTTSYTYANVRNVNDKVAADFEYLLSLYPNLFSREKLAMWKTDFYSWMYEGYAESIQVQFIRNDLCFCEIEWYVKDDGSIAGDDNVGRIRVNNLNGASTKVFINTTFKWDRLSDDEKSKFYRKLDDSWEPGNPVGYVAGLIKKVDKQYSSGSFGVQRSILGGTP